MNRESWEKTETECNVCGALVEVGSASTRCGNRSCPTRELGLNTLSTDSTEAEQATFYVQDTIRTLDLDLGGAEMDPTDLAARARVEMQEGDVSLDELVAAAEYILETGSTTYIGGHEFGWKCGACGEFQDVGSGKNVTDGTVLDCSNCPNERRVVIE